MAQSVSARYLYDSIQQSDAEVVSSSLTWSTTFRDADASATEDYVQYLGRGIVIIIVIILIIY